MADLDPVFSGRRRRIDAMIRDAVVRSSERRRAVLASGWSETQMERLGYSELAVRAR